MRSIVILGSTGSIGKNTLDVARHLGKEKIRVRALAAKSNIDALASQIEEFSPEAVAVFDETQASALQKRYPKLSVLAGMEGICSLASLDGKPLVVSAMAGTLGIRPTLAAILAGNDVALANKETLVSGGSLVMRLAQQHHVRLLPVDSEHSAIFQCLQGVPHAHIRRLILTASGGPFRQLSKEQLRQVSPSQALKHPNWMMGPKITIDSSTLMNKGLEVIEAHWLYNIPVEKIDVVIHPQSIIHSFVELVDLSILAQLSNPDMRLPIQYALTYPERVPGQIKPLDFLQSFSMEFLPPDFDKFKCLDLAYRSIRSGNSYPCFLNAANEILVDRFIRGEISWTDIPAGLEELLERHSPLPVDTVDEILDIDRDARLSAQTLKFT